LEQKHQKSVADVRNMVDAVKAQEKSGSFMSVSTLLLTRGPTTHYYVRLAKPVNPRDFAGILMKVEEELKRVAEETV
jgi:pyruvate/oxaloacetate carboxyltransferase